MNQGASRAKCHAVGSPLERGVRPHLHADPFDEHLASAPLPLARNSVSVAVHLHAGAVGEKVLCLGARLHLRTVLPTIATEAAGFGRCRVGSWFAVFEADARWCRDRAVGSCCWSGRWGRNLVLGRCSGRFTSPRFLSIQFLERWRLANLVRRTRLALIGDRAIHHALVHLRSRDS
jgi:hypothetical protein